MIMKRLLNNNLSLIFQLASNRPRKIDINRLKLKNVDKKLAETILGEIIDTEPNVDFKDIGEIRENHS